MPTAAVSFRSGAAFRRWLQRHHATETELLVRLFKVHAAASGMTYRDALDEALSVGWIDGVRRGLDEESFTIRFTPRKAKSYWSDVNVKRAKELIAEGRMTAAGLAAYQQHDPKRAPKYSFEAGEAKFDAAATRRFRADRKAWAFFQKQAPWYRRTSTFWVTSAKRPETRERRLDQLIARSRAEVPIELLRRNPKATTVGAVAALLLLVRSLGAQIAGPPRPVPPGPPPKPAKFVTNVNVVPNTFNYSATCPAKLTFTATIRVGSIPPKAIVYQWLRSDNTVSPKRTIKMTSTSATVTDSWNTGISGEMMRVWKQLKILSPDEVTSNQAVVAVLCR